MQTNLFAFCIFVKNHTKMRSRLELMRGIPPGKIIDRDLRRKNLSQRSFASSIGEHSQTLNAVIAGRRRLTTEMALKIEKAFGYEEGALLVLQVYADIAQTKRRMQELTAKSIPNIRRELFWDTDFDALDWQLYREGIIARVIERGNDQEKREIASFYGLDYYSMSRPKNAYKLKNSTK